MLPRDYTRLGAEGGPPAPSRGGQQGGQTLLFNLIQFSLGHPPWAPRERISREKERSTSGPPDIASTRSALQVGARGVWELGDSGLGAALPPRNSHSKMAVTTLSPSLKREALGRQA